MLNLKRSRTQNSFSYLLFCALLFQIWVCIICNNVFADTLDQNNKAREGKISPWLLSNIHTSTTSGFLVILQEQADLRAARLHIRKEDKTRSVHESLRNTSKETQSGLRKWLDERGIKYQSYSIVNMLLVYGNETLISILAARPDVLRIEGNPVVRGIEPRETLETRSINEGQINTPADRDNIASPVAVEWNITKVRAPEVWSTFGTTGTGIVVAGNDTGVQWDHPALINSYRGWNGSQVDHSYNWHDAIRIDSPPYGDGNSCGYASSAPCDDHGHGTHTLGTIVGGDGGSNQIGIAPGAQWIACRNMDNGSGTPATYLECLEFFLAPYPFGANPSQGDSSKAPHVVNNSWSCPPSEGCGVDTLLTAVDNLRAAGIMVVVSAGNSGSACSTVSDPPAIYDASFSVGATTSNDDIAPFSSRGPVTVDGSNRLKPNISAPGVSIRSSVPFDTYSFMSGTSMAGPHVAGAVALLWSASPIFVGDIDATETLLEENALPLTTIQECGGIPGSQIPNNTYGWGRLDIFAAVQDALRAPQYKLKVTRKRMKRGDGVILSDDGAIICTADTKQCRALYDNGTFVTLNGQASYPNTFLGWQPGDLCPGTDECTVLMDGSKNIKGIFHGPNRLAVMIRSVKKGTGTVTGPNLSCPGGCKTNYQKDELVSLLATAGNDSTFTGWVGCPLPSENTCTITMDRAYKVKAVFTGPLLSE